MEKMILQPGPAGEYALDLHRWRKGILGRKHSESHRTGVRKHAGKCGGMTDNSGPTENSLCKEKHERESGKGHRHKCVRSLERQHKERSLQGMLPLHVPKIVLVTSPHLSEIGRIYIYIFFLIGRILG